VCQTARRFLSITAARMNLLLWRSAYQIFGRLDRDPLAAEFSHERIGVLRISKAKADVIGYRLAAQVRARLVRYRARVTELVHRHQPPDEAAFGNEDRDLVRKVRGRFYFLVNSPLRWVTLSSASSDQRTRLLGLSYQSFPASQQLGGKRAQFFPIKFQAEKAR
jgi:hypothetical protein